LKVRIDADPYRPGDAPIVTNLIVRHTEKTVGKYLTYPVRIDSEQGVRSQGAPGTAYDIVLGDEPTFCEKLTLMVERTDAAERSFRLQIANRGQVREDIFGVDWRWRTTDGQQYIDLTFPEVRAQTLRLVITDYLNAPLKFSDAKATMAARQLIFESPVGKTLPLKLYFGYASALDPNYDFEKRLPPTIDPLPSPVELGPRQANPNYIPPEPEFSERHPWVIYCVLGFACLVLAGLLVPLAKQALATAPSVGHSSPDVKR
jgi:hypothetical protein